MSRLRLAAPKVRTASLAKARVPGKTADGFYLSAEWKALREACLKRDGYRCAVEGCNRTAVVADHIMSRRAGGADALANLRSLCRHHDARFKEGPLGRRTPGG